MLTVVDEYSRECLAIRVNYRMKAHDVINALSDLFLMYGLPDHIRSDNGSEFTSSSPLMGSRSSVLNGCCVFMVTESERNHINAIGLV